MSAAGHGPTALLLQGDAGIGNLCPAELARRIPIEIAALTSKEFIHPDRATFPNDETYAFRHVLTCNAAYEAMLRRTRAAPNWKRCPRATT